MKMNLIIGRRVLRNGLVLTTTLLTCVAMQANEHDDKHRAGADKAHKEHADKGGPMTAEKFVQKAQASGQMEVKMGQLGQQQGQNQQVKQLAAALVKDHTQANQKLQQIASRKNITADRSSAGGDQQKHQQHMQKLQGKSGAEFDKEFVKMALKHHKKDIKEFERAQTQVNDPELKSFISETLPKLRQHYQMAQAAARSVGVDEASIAAEIEADDTAAGAAAGGVKGSVELEQDRPNSTLDGATQTDDSGTINQNADQTDKDLSLSTDADVDADVDVDTDEKIFQEGDGKILGLPTSKTDGKFLGIIPNPGADNDEADAEVEVDVDADADDSTVGGSADIETGTSKDDNK